MVPLPRHSDAGKIGESSSQVARRFFSLTVINQLKNFGSVIKEYMDLGHAELVPATEMDKPPSRVFYLPIHVVCKDLSTTTKIKVVFDALGKSATAWGIMNDTINTCTYQTTCALISCLCTHIVLSQLYCCNG